MKSGKEHIKQKFIYTPLLLNSNGVYIYKKLVQKLPDIKNILFFYHINFCIFAHNT